MATRSDENPPPSLEKPTPEKKPLKKGRGKRIPKSKTKAKAKKPEIVDKPPTNFLNYVLGKELGRGQYGIVYHGYNKESMEYVAIKTIALRKCGDAIGSVQSEIDLMKMLDNEHIVKYITSHTTEDYLYIVMEFAEGGSLQGVQQKYSNFGEHILAKYMHQVLIGLSYLHSQSVIHRDIKAANILLAHNIAKLADFGISVKLGGEGTTSPDAEGACSPYWAAPEVIMMEPATEKCDIWSLGVTAIEMFQGQPPYFDLSAMPAMFKIVQGGDLPLPQGITSEFRDFLTVCLKKDVPFRADCAQLLQHKWIFKHTTESVYIAPNTVDDRFKKFVHPDEEEDFDDVFETAAPTHFTQNEHSTQVPQAPPVPDLSTLTSHKTKSGGLHDFEDDSDDMDFDDGGGPLQFAQPDRIRANIGADVFDVGGKKKSAAQNTLDKFQENDDSDDDDFLEDSSNKKGGGGGLGLQFFQPIKASSVELSNIFDDYDDTKAQQEQEKLQITMRGLVQNLEQIHEDEELSPKQIDELVGKVMDVIHYEPSIFSNFIAYHGTVPLVAIVQNDDITILEKCLPIVIELLKPRIAEVQIEQDKLRKEQGKIHKMLCILGILPSLFTYSINANDHYGKRVQLDAVNILNLLCAKKMSNKSLRMFIAAGGLMIVQKIFAGYSHAQRPEVTGPLIQIIDAVFSFSSSTPKSCFARIFAQSGLIPLLGQRFAAMDNLDADAESFTILCRDLEIFSQADTSVRIEMSEASFITNIFTKAAYEKNLPQTNNNPGYRPLLSSWDQFSIISMVSNLSMDTGIVQKLWLTSLVEELVKYLQISREEFSMNPTLTLCFSALFHISRLLNESDVPKIAPLIPMILYLIKHETVLKEQSIKLLFKFINDHSGNNQMRIRLLRNGSLNILVKLIRSHSNKEEVLAAIESFAKNAGAQVQEFLIKNIDEFVDPLIELIQSGEMDQIEKCSPRIGIILEKCPQLAIQLSQSKFSQAVILFLMEDLDLTPAVKVDFLNLAVNLYRSHPKPKQMIARFRLDRLANKYVTDEAEGVKALVHQIFLAVSSNFIL